MTDLKEKFREKKGSIGRIRKQLEQEYGQKEFEAEFKEAEAELS